MVSAIERIKRLFNWDLGFLVFSVSKEDPVVIGDPENPIGFVWVSKVQGPNKVKLVFSFDKQVQVNRFSVGLEQLGVKELEDSLK